MKYNELERKLKKLGVIPLERAKAVIPCGIVCGATASNSIIK